MPNLYITNNLSYYKAKITLIAYNINLLRLLPNCNGTREMFLTADFNGLFVFNLSVAYPFPILM